MQNYLDMNWKPRLTYIHTIRELSNLNHDLDANSWFQTVFDTAFWWSFVVICQPPLIMSVLLISFCFLHPLLVLCVGIGQLD